MFGNLRKKFNSVIQDGLTFTDSVTHLRNQNTPVFNVSVPKSINLYAGSELLEKNETNWSEIHAMDEKNSKKAVFIDVTINLLKNKSNKLLTDISDLNVSLVSLPTVITTLNSCIETIDDIGTKCQSFEKKLSELEDLLEVLELQGQQLDHRFEMAMYKEKKMAELDKVREELAANHAANVKDYELSLRKIQHERQLAFQDAFQDDLKCYKEMGSIPKVEHKNVSNETVSLEEIILDDQDTKELDDFLKE